jgi:hypothetical protein
VKGTLPNRFEFTFTPKLYLKEVNETPVVFRWKYKLETLTVV